MLSPGHQGHIHWVMLGLALVPSQSRPPAELWMLETALAQSSPSPPAAGAPRGAFGKGQGDFCMGLQVRLAAPTLGKVQSEPAYTLNPGPSTHFCLVHNPSASEPPAPAKRSREASAKYDCCIQTTTRLTAAGSKHPWEQFLPGCLSVDLEPNPSSSPRPFPCTLWSNLHPPQSTLP